VNFERKKTLRKGPTGGNVFRANPKKKGVTGVSTRQTKKKAKKNLQKGGKKE